MKIGQLVLKTAGRDGNNLGVVVDILDKNYVLVDGNTRRKKVNIKHIEPVNKVLKIKKGASTSEVQKALKEANIPIIKKGSKRTPKKQDVTPKKLDRKEQKPKKKVK